MPRAVRVAFDQAGAGPTDPELARAIARRIVGEAPRTGTLSAALLPVYGYGWAAGEHAAHDQLRGIVKDDSTKTLPAAPDPSRWVDWTSWVAGDPIAAAIINDDGLQALLNTATGVDDSWGERAAARGSILANVEDGRLTALADLIAEHLEMGSSADTLSAALVAAGDLLTDEAWADTIAVTEMARAMTASSLSLYAEHGIAEKEFETAPDQRVCVRCISNEEQGAIPVNVPFDQGDPPVHPSCRCAVVPVVSVPDDISSITEE